MNTQKPFGGLSAEDIESGDLVKWTKWNPKESKWDEMIGVVLSVEEQIKGGRLVSSAKVATLQHPQIELDFFTMSLKLVSKGYKKD
tara:strand:- start:551 stop:808 length:258 start_codon:yes stop_codon:yes gene_type:complete